VIVLPLSLVDSTVFVDQDTETLSFALYECAFVKGVFRALQTELFSLADHLIIKQLG